ncbi:MAG: hypothetical protein M3396_07220 [Actinomycetota bacterium]|nr:hypothetical protein [Actinomycetota bacterium]MDQ3573734.1 hypothetical protein [Actinomycetota bacterium]
MLGWAGLLLAGTAGSASANHKPKHTAKQGDQARRLCERSGGTFIRVDNLVYAWLFPGGSVDLLDVGTPSTNPPPRDRAGRLCVKSGGTFIRVDNLVYACLLPGGSVDLL